METVVYVDTLFIINFVMDGICLLLSSVWLSERVRPWRLIAASLFGGFYSVAVTALPLSVPLLYLTVHFVSAVVICLIAAKWDGVRMLAKRFVCFFFACAVMGGILFAVFALGGSFATYGGAFYGEPTAATVIICGVIAGSVIVYCLGKLRTKSKSLYCDLKIKYRGKECVANCITDSGNLLTCPFTALPVAIIGADAANELFSGEELERLKLTPVSEGVRPLPVKGVGGDVLLPSFVPDKTEVRCFGDKAFAEKRLCIALQLNGKGFGGKDGIVPSSVL